MFNEIRRVFDRRPWAAHLYVTERCNLDCHYCNEYDNTLPHPTVADLTAWMEKIRELGVLRLGLQGGEPLLHPQIVDIVATAHELGFRPLSMSTNGFLLTPELVAELDRAGLGSLHVSVDRMTPVDSTRKSLKTIRDKLAPVLASGIRLNISGVLFEDTLEEMAEVVDACLDMGVPTQMRAVHDDLINGVRLRNRDTSRRILDFVERQRTLKRNGAAIHTSWGTLEYQRALLAGKPVRWRCAAGYKYFFVSSTGRFWLCSQVRTDRHILDVTPADLLENDREKGCQKDCGVYCIVDTSMKVSRPLRFATIELRGRIERALREHTDAARRMRNLPREHRGDRSP